MMTATLEAPQIIDETATTLALINRCQMKDPDAYNELLSQYNSRIFNTAFRILGEETSAEDALQETLLNIYRGLANFRGESKISTWISKITINVCLGMLRKNKNRQYLDLDDESVPDLPASLTPYSDPMSYASNAEMRELIEEAFSRMSEKQGAVVRLHDMEGNTILDIASMIRVPEGTIKSRLFYGRQEFKTIYSALLDERRQQKVTVQ